MRYGKHEGMMPMRSDEFAEEFSPLAPGLAAALFGQFEGVFSAASGGQGPGRQDLRKLEFGLKRNIHS
jgi:hypothetical protein